MYIFKEEERKSKEGDDEDAVERAKKNPLQANLKIELKSIGTINGIEEFGIFATEDIQVLYKYITLREDIYSIE